jgi:hypothetical protein
MPSATFPLIALPKLAAGPYTGEASAQHFRYHHPECAIEQPDDPNAIHAQTAGRSRSIVTPGFRMSATID